MSRYPLSTLTSFRRFLFLVTILLSALIAGSVVGCGGDDPVAPPVESDAGATPRLDGSTTVDTGVVDIDSSITLDAGSDSATDGATVDAADGGDASVPTLSIDSVTANEGATGATSLTFTVTLSAAATSPVTVDYATADGTAVTSATAVGGPDYTSSTGTLTFAAGDTSKTVTVAVNGDSTNEADETFTVTLAAPTNATIAQGTGTGTIVNDDAVPAIAIADALVVEGNTGTTPATFTATLSAASGQSVTVSYATADATATAGSDYTAVAATVVTFAPGEVTKDIVVDVTGETAIESSETFTVNLSAPGNATITNTSATGTIQNDDGAAQPLLSVNDVSVTEGNASTKVLNFTVSLSAAGALPVTVNVATVDGTATTAGNDYQAINGTVTFALGETSKNVSVVIVGDVANENDETFTVVLSNPQNAIVANGGGQGTGTITNDDAVPTLVINDVSVAEGQAGTSALTFTVALSAISGRAVSVAFSSADGTATAGGAAATGGQDYTAVSGTLVIPAGTLSGPVTVNVAGDVLNEASETLVVTLANPSNATLGAKVQGTGTITNDDALPALVIGDVSVSEGDTGTTNAVFTVSLVNASSNPAPSGRTVSVNFATANGTAVAPSDYTADTGTLTFAAGETSKTISVVVNGDATAETSETFSLTLSAASNASVQDGTAIGTILNDDGNLPLLNIDSQSVVEGNAGTATLTFNVTLSATSAQPVTVNYATQNGTAISGGVLASGGQDYVATSGVLTFAPGATSQTVTVTVNGDAANEADETFNVVLSNVSTTAQIQDGSGLGTITNDDALPTLSVADASAPEGNAGTANLNLVVTLSAVSGRTITVSYDSSDVTATTTGLRVEGGTDYTAVNGTLTFLPGEVTKNIAVPVNGDTAREGDDTFAITLANAVNAGIADATGLGTITNDDLVPTVSIANVTRAEGTPAPNTANTTLFVFNVTLSNTASSTVLVSYATANGTATIAGNDYSLAAGTLTFAPGESVKTITVLVDKDATVEGNETFLVNLNAATNATIADNQAVGTITNDD